MTWIKGWYDDKVASVPEGGRSTGHQPSGMMEPSYGMLNYNTFDCMNDTYWEELMADFNPMPM